jgi:hypothetical protein
MTLTNDRGKIPTGESQDCASNGPRLQNFLNPLLTLRRCLAYRYIVALTTRRHRLPMENSATAKDDNLIGQLTLHDSQLSIAPNFCLCSAWIVQVTTFKNGFPFKILSHVSYLCPSTYTFNSLYQLLLVFGILHPSTCSYGCCFLFSLLQMFTYTTCFGPTGHHHVKSMVSHCRSFKVTAADSFLDLHCAAVQMLRIYGFRLSNSSLVSV